MLLRFGRYKVGPLHGEWYHVNPLTVHMAEGGPCQLGCDRVAHLRK